MNNKRKYPSCMIHDSDAASKVPSCKSFDLTLSCHLLRILGGRRSSSRRPKLDYHKDEMAWLICTSAANCSSEMNQGAIKKKKKKEREREKKNSSRRPLLCRVL
ncbi:hypothetical protein PUN28_016229 [Cardiocondyla obscurior]|uniref:Uncharacterized protein n=1 Tax=Cardiocondyla obscurior TaxID=286306 RepID=A0AAW2ERJ9_9HYME